MDTFNFSTVYMAVLTSNLLLSIIAVIILNKKILFNAGYKLISIFLILTAVRFMLPIQLPFATNIIFPQEISRIIIDFFAPRFAVGRFNLSIYNIVIAIWISGTLIQVTRFIYTNRKILRYILIFGRNVTKHSRYADVLHKIYESKTSRFPFRVFELPEVNSPFLFGFATPYIVVPSDFQCSDKELSYILKHETMHFKHHDLWIKFGAQMLTILYWWNPLSYVFRDQVNLAIEMRIDDNVTEMDQGASLEYMNCLYRLAKFQDDFFNHKMGNIIMFSQHEDTLMTRRFETFVHGKVKKNYILNIALTLLIGCIYICSYLFIFEADYYIDEIDQIGFRTEDVNSFAVDNEDGTYSIYMFDACIDVVDSLEYYGDDIPVMTKEEFEHVQQEKPEQD